MPFFILSFCPCALQASIWDVDGTGMQQVPSAELDLALRKVGTWCIALQFITQELLGMYASGVAHSTPSTTT
mgnify:CR=1 FL=1